MHETKSHNSIRMLVGLMVVAVLMLGAAACGDDDDGAEVGGDGTTTTDGDGDSEQLSMAVSIPAAVAELSQVYFADYQGYFDEENLDVEISVDGGNVITNVVGGRADVAITGIGGGLAATNEGRETSIIYWWSGDGAAGFVIGGPDVESTEDCGSVSTFPEGTSAFGWAQFYNDALGADWEIVTSPDVPTQIAGLQSGQFDCAVSAVGAFQALVDKGDARIVVDPRDESTLPEEVADFNLVEAAAFGLSDNLQDKSEAIERFVRALDKAREYMEGASAEELASGLIDGNTGDWDGQTQEGLTSSFEAARDFFAPNDGFIPPEAWQAEQLIFFVNGGLPFIDPDDEKWSYEERVDMSYYENAIG